MGFIRMSDLGQVMMATGGGGGGGGGGGLARQATQARGYVMPGHTPPVNQPTISMPVSTPRISTPTPAPAPTGGSSISIATPGGGGTPPPPTRTTITTTTITPPSQPTFSVVAPDYNPHTIVYIEGASDPYNEFANSAVDDGSEAQSLEPESKSEYIDPFDQKKEENKGPFNVFKIEDDPTLNDLTPQERQTVEEVREADRLAGLAVGIVVGAALGVAACKLWNWWRRPQ